MKFLACSKLSDHRYKTSEGYLVCVDSILSRTGVQSYTRDELFHDGCTDEVDVDRSPDEVFSDKTLASFENKPLTIEHPDEDVNSTNHNKYAVGFIRDIKRGKDGADDVMLGTIVVTDAEAIELIETGKLKELSCGYDCDIADEPNPCQRNIRGNHVALCEHGRAGIARIVDSCKDSVKDAKYVIMHPRKNLYLTVGAKAWSYESDPMIKKFDSEKEAEEYAKKNTSDFRIAVFDSIKDARISDARVGFSGEHKSDGNNFYGYMYVEHPRLGDFYVSFKVKRHGRDVQLDGKPWNFIKVKGYTAEQKKWIIQHKQELDKINTTSATIADQQSHSNDSTFEVCYIDDGDVCIAIEAKDENDARRKFRRNYGMYYIKHIRKVKDGVKDTKNIDDRLIEIPENHLRRFEEQLKMRKIHVVSRGRTTMGRIHYQVEFGGPARQLAKLLNELDDIMDRQNIPMTYSAGGNDNDYSTAGIDLDKMYVKDCKDEDPYEKSTEGLEEAEKNLHDETIYNDCNMKDSVKKIYSIIRAINKIHDAKETKLSFTAMPDFKNIDMSNSLTNKLASSGIDYARPTVSNNKYSIVIIGDDEDVHRAKILIENIGFFSKWN